ncbi:MAG: tRNA guanosine(34) transglycosylase Tgt [Candidatus Saccharibacteria bacterium]|nr:tRNA guanosine(34) transglycosylase Tgt [Candidatus Saccharibacteria bacterium]
MKRDFSFDIVARGGADTPLARAGIIHTPHGNIMTPTFNVVGTHAEVKFVSPTDLATTGAQVMLSNGYHLHHRATVISASGGLAGYSGWNRPTFTDSGGFQVMSLGSGLGKVVSMAQSDADVSERLREPDERLALVDDEGVEFRDPFSGRIIKFTPELSIATQHKIGADVMMSFDELTNISDTYDYNVRALERTRRWAERGLREHIRQTALRTGKPYQALYGVLQGAYFLDLRAKAARDISTMNIDGWDFDGFGLGGALEKDNLAEIIRVMNEILPEDKPRHLLGLSHPDDIFDGVDNGCDTFDCVAPTREARHGRIYTLDGNYNLKRSEFIADERVLMDGCDCTTCRAGHSRAELRALLKSSSLDDHVKAYNLLSIHNIRFIVRLMEQIRSSIIDGSYFSFRDNWKARYYSN